MEVLEQRHDLEQVRAFHLSCLSAPRPLNEEELRLDSGRLSRMGYLRTESPLEGLIRAQ